MTGRDGPQPAPARTIARAVGVRLIAVAALGLLALLALADIGSFPRRWFRTPAVPDQLAAWDGAEVGWPHRRGPRYNGVSSETDLADAWPSEGPPVLWARSCGRGYSGITVVGGRMYTQTQSLTGQYVECLDADTGELVWRYRYGWPYEPGGMYPGPRATPTWHQGRIYFAAPDGLVGCLRAVDGKPLWQTNVNDRFGGRGTEFGYPVHQ